MIETVERIDLSDLDLLDDAKRHCRCTYCVPVAGPLVPHVAICGRRVAHREPYEGRPWDVPANACEECRQLWLQPCARCGR